MNFNQLKIFYFAAKYGSLSAAAEALYITQPAVTKSIQRLQEHYGIKFVNRFGKKLALTDAGEVLYGIAENILQMEAQAEESIRDFQQGKRGHIRINASESFGAYYLPAMTLPFCKANPQIRVSVNILPTELVVENTVNLNGDLGFISYPVGHPKLRVEEVLEDRLVLIAPPNQTFSREDLLDPHDLQGRSVIMHEQGSATQRAIEEFLRKNNLSVFVSQELSNNEAIKRAVESGIGLSVISQRVASREIEAGKLKAVLLSDQSMRRKFFMVHHIDKYFSESLQGLIDAVYRWAREYTRTLS
jgi:DNA-binding transcriptional LysR family regulator